MNIIKECILSSVLIASGFIIAAKCPSVEQQETADKNNLIYIEDFVPTSIKKDILQTELTAEVNRYITSKAPESKLSASLIVKHCLADSVDVILALTQCQLESNFGTLGRASKTNSAWNVGAWDNADHTKSINYKSVNESIPVYTKLISKKYSAADPYKNFVDDKGRRYATDPDYEHKLLKQSNYIKSVTKIDSLQNRLNQI